MSERFDFIICGAGLSGLSLAHRLAEDAFSDKKILILDKSKKDQNDRTWSFWTRNDDNRYQSLYRKSWNKLAFYAPGFEIIQTPGEYAYHTISGLDFYRYSFEMIERTDRITFVNTEIESIHDHIDHVVVKTADGEFKADYVFDSTVKKFPEDHSLFVWQHFLGWEVTLNSGTFSSDTATFMDFRIDQEGDTRFVYVLPFDEKRALVEATIFSRNIAERSDYEVILKNYMKKYIGDDYQVGHTELGAIPMTTAKFGSGSQRVICLGTNNATVKPSSGYAFMRIQRECDQLIHFIKNEDIKGVIPRRRFLAYDRTLLNVLLTEKETGREVFTMLFRNNRMQSILKFLDEKTSLFEEVQIFRTLPFWSFLRAFLKENVFLSTNSKTISNS